MTGRRSDVKDLRLDASRVELGPGEIFPRQFRIGRCRGLLGNRVEGFRTVDGLCGARYTGQSVLD